MLYEGFDRVCVLQTLLKHKSRLELAKESAKQRTPLQHRKPGLKRESSGFGGQVGMLWKNTPSFSSFQAYLGTYKDEQVPCRHVLRDF